MRRFINWILSFFGRVLCDRCHQTAQGFIGKPFSAGVYVGWSKYMDPGEHIICDACMWKDERFLADYPYIAKP